MSARRKAKPVRRRRAKKGLAAGLLFSVAGGFVVAREEKTHIELPSYPEVHGEHLETMMSTATFTHYSIFNPLTLSTGTE
jgi:hypothetical protein